NGFIDGGKRSGKSDDSGIKTSLSIQADPSMNALVVRADPTEMSEIKSIINQLDLRRAQILIEAAIVEVGGDKGLDLGFQWAAGSADSCYGGTDSTNVGISTGDIVSSVRSEER